MSKWCLRIWGIVFLLLESVTHPLFSSEPNCPSLFTSFQTLPKPLSSISFQDTLTDLIDTPYNDISTSEFQNILETLSYSLRYDSGLLPGTEESASFKLFSFTNILDYIIPLILVHENRTTSLINLIHSILSTPHTYPSTANGGQYIRRVHSRYNDYLLKLQKRLINYIVDSTTFEDLPIVLSFLSDEGLLYLKNNSLLTRKYTDIKSYLNYISLTTDSSYISNLSKKALERLEKTSNLQEEISENFIAVYRNSNASNIFRERVSLKIVMLYEIEHGRLPRDLGGSSYISVGYDILSVSDEQAYFIEVKSKMDLFTSYPTRITRNEADVALNIHKNYPNGDYHIYLVPLGRDDIKKIKDPLIDLKIDWDKLNDIVLNRDTYKSVRIPLSDFTSTTVELNVK